MTSHCRKAGNCREIQFKVAVLNSDHPRQVKCSMLGTTVISLSGQFAALMFNL